MKFSFFAALVLAASPLAVQSWSCAPGGGRRSSFSSVYPNMNGGRFRSRRGPPGRQSPYVARRRRALADRMLEKTDQIFREGAPQQCSPPGFQQQYYKYNLIDDDSKFELSIDVPGIKMEDIDIRLEDDDRFLTVSGERAASSSCNFASKFSQTFQLDPVVDVDNITATLALGVLTVTAPKDVQPLENTVRKIPVTSTTTDVADDVDVGTTKNVDIDPSSSSSSVPGDGNGIADQKKDEDETVSAARTNSGVGEAIGLVKPSKTEDKEDSVLSEKASLSTNKAEEAAGSDKKSLEDSEEEG